MEELEYGFGNEKVFLRCGKCGDVVCVSSEKKEEEACCQKCKNKIGIPGAGEIESRKLGREIIKVSEFAIPIPDSLTGKDKPDKPLRIMYTEASPIQFALKRKNSRPLLDLSQGGIGFIYAGDNAEYVFNIGQAIAVEIDFPIFEEPLVTYAQVCWFKPLQIENLFRVGLRFRKIDEDFRNLLDRLDNYLTSRMENW